MIEAYDVENEGDDGEGYEDAGKASMLGDNEVESDGGEQDSAAGKEGGDGEVGVARMVFRIGGCSSVDSLVSD